MKGNLTMGNLVFVCLGSNYDPVLEERFEFIQNHLESGNKVKVLSIDSQPLPTIKTDNKKQLSVKRIQQFLQDDMMTEFVAEHIAKIKDIDEIVICDGIHFMKSEIGMTLQQEISQAFEHKVPVTLFRYISPKYANAHFNNKPLQESNQFDFANFISENRNNLLSLFKDPIKGEQVLNQISKSIVFANQSSYAVIQKFLTNAGDKLLKSDGPELFRTYLHKYVVENISSDLVKDVKPRRNKSMP